MCGILVAYNPEGTRTTKGIAQSALAKIKHRGPDQIGEWSNEFWYFGSTRLAVTGGEESRQNVISPDGR